MNLSNVTVLRNSAFQNCNQLTNIVKFNNQLTKIESSCFFGTKLEGEITIPDSLSVLGDWSFAGIQGSFTLTIGSGVKTIPKYLVRNSLKLTSFTFSDNLETISDYAFQGCSGLKSIGDCSKLKKIGLNAFDGCSSLSRRHYS